MQPGQVLSNRYRLESMLGQGGMGSVFRAEHLGLKAPVAVKLMDPEIARNPEALARFHREAHAAATIRSSHVVQVLDHGVDEASATAFIVMELLEGETLGTRLTRRGKLPPEETAHILADVCRALSRAHQAGIVHRDLKPENIFLVKDEREFAKVLDFGVAKAQPHALNPGGSTRTGSLVGTPCYMSPEQIGGSKQLDARSDLWSVAVIACECITGKRPFDAETVGGLALAICMRPIPRASSLGPVTPAFEAWLERGLERDAERRFQSARELSEALSTACDTELPTVSSLPVAAEVSGSSATLVAAPSPAPANPPDSYAARPLSNTFPVTRRQLSARQRVIAMGSAALLVSAFAGVGLRERRTPPTTAASAAPPPGLPPATAVAPSVPPVAATTPVAEQARAAPPPASVVPLASAAPAPSPGVAAAAVPLRVAGERQRPSQSIRKRPSAKARPRPPAAAAEVTLESALEGERGKVRN